MGGCTSHPPPQCGVASLVALLAKAGRPVPYAALLRQTHVVAGHTTFIDLARTAARKGVPMKGYRLTDPMLLRPDDLGVVELTADHFVAFVGRKGDIFLIVDSPDGAPHPPAAWSAARLEGEWTGNVLLVQRTAKGNSE